MKLSRKFKRAYKTIGETHLMLSPHGRTGVVAKNEDKPKTD